MLSVYPDVLVISDLPAYGSVSSALPARYTFHNRTNRVQEMKIELDSSDACLFSGYKQVYAVLEA